MFPSLSKLFKQLASTVPNEYDFKEPSENSDSKEFHYFLDTFRSLESQILHELRDCTALKVLANTNRISDLWKIPKIGLMLYDVLVISGGKVLFLINEVLISSMSGQKAI